MQFDFGLRTSRFKMVRFLLNEISLILALPSSNIFPDRASVAPKRYEIKQTLLSYACLFQLC